MSVSRCASDATGESSNHDSQQNDESRLWDSSVRRQIRKKMRDEINDVHKNRDDITIPNSLIRRIDNLNCIFSDVVAPKEAAIDSEGFRLLSAIGREQVEATQGSLIQFDTTSYVEKLVTYMGGRRGEGRRDDRVGYLNWTLVGSRAENIFRKPPSVNFMFGTLELEPPKKKLTNARRSKADKEAGHGAGSKPKEVGELNNEEESTTKDVSHIWKYLAEACRNQGRVNYFKFLLDPTSFGRTVENMFHFSFLIKDGRMGLTIGRDELPYIYIPSDTVNGQSTKTTKNQAIISMTMVDWRRAREKFDIRSAKIPPRE